MEWLAGVIFAMYGWNSMPVAGTDIIWSFVVKGRVFPFPIDLAAAPHEACSLPELQQVK
jgi:hypothetical protein